MSEMANNKSRKRAPNFSEGEKAVLTQLIQEYRYILENKKSDTITSKEKDKCWQVIEHAFNSRSFGEYRNFEVLRSCWDNLKKKTRKFFADEKMQLYKTGGGSYESRSDMLLENVREIIKPSVDGITNNFDSDAIADDNINLCKLSTVSNKNLDEATTSNNGRNVMSEWVDENDNITDESMHEDDILNFLKKQNVAGMLEKESYNVESNNVLNIHTVMDDNENDRTQINTNNLYGKSKMQRLEKQNIGNKTSAVGILTSNISTPLKKRLSKYEDSLRNSKERKQYKKQESITSKISQYNILGDAKIELVQFMIEDLKAKSEIETKILTTQLEKEKLEVQILKKELELKENMLQSKQQKIRF